MIQEILLDGNRIIAEFMGLQVIEINGDLCHYKSMFTVEYHTSWDWLMKVVEKIEGLNKTVSITNRMCAISDNKGHVISVAERWETKIETVWVAVTTFIKWHNQNK